MYSLTLESEAFDTLPLEQRARIVAVYVDALAQSNLIWLQRFSAPSVYDSGVVYADQEPLLNPFDGSEEARTDRWQDIPRLLTTGAGACEDLSAWRIAELRAAGCDAWPDILVQSDGANVLYHVRVGTPDGIEDPSAVLGMPASPDYLATIGMVAA